MRLIEDFRQSLRVEGARRDDANLVILAADQPGERILLQVEESRGSLDVSERLRVLRFQCGKPLSAGQHEFHAADQFLMMCLADPEQVHNIACLLYTSQSPRDRQKNS